MTDFHRILMPTDFEEASTRALDMAISLSNRFGTELIIMHAWELPAYSYAAMLYATADFSAPLAEAARSQLESCVASAKQHVASVRAILRSGAAWQEILRTSEDERADLVVLGTHGRRGVSRALLGSVAEKVVRLSAIPVLTVRA